MKKPLTTRALEYYPESRVMQARWIRSMRRLLRRGKCLEAGAAVKWGVPGPIPPAYPTKGQP